MGVVSWILVCSATIVGLAQLVCVGSALLGGREHRLHLTGAFALSHVALILCLMATIHLSRRISPSRLRNGLLGLTSGFLAIQAILFAFG